VSSTDRNLEDVGCAQATQASSHLPVTWAQLSPHNGSAQAGALRIRRDRDAVAPLSDASIRLKCQDALVDHTRRSYVCFAFAAFAGVIWLYELVALIRERDLQMQGDLPVAALSARVALLIGLVPFVYTLASLYRHSRSQVQYFRAMLSRLQES
jgi:hypothetical protein